MRAASALSLMLLAAGLVAAAPPGGALHGTIVDADTGEPVPDAVIAVLGARRGAVADAVGTFAIDGLEAGTYRVECTHVGYQAQRLEITVPAAGAVQLDISLTERAIRLSAVTVTPSRFAIMGREPQARQALTEDEIQSIPHYGEDIYRAVTRLPGVAAGGDFSARFTVRGGEHDEVLVLLDGLQVYEPFHLKDISGGAVSIVDVMAIEGVDLMTGGFPAEYGDRMSGVFNITSRTPRADRERHSVGLSFMNARAMSEGTFERGSWLVSARRGYLDLVLWMMRESEDLRPNYYDVLGKVDYELAPSHRLSAHLLHAGDTLELLESDDDVNNTSYGNSYAWLNLTSLLGPRLSAQTLLAGGQVEHDRAGTAVMWDLERPDFAVADERRFRFLELKQDWNWELSDRHYLKGGVDLKRQTAAYDYLSTDESYFNVSPDSVAVVTDTIDVHLKPSGTAIGLYGADRFRLSRRLTAEIGLRYDRPSHGRDGLLSPRLNLAFSPGHGTALRGAWGRYYQSQEIHQIGVQDGEEGFLPAELAEHWVLGLEHALANGLQLRVEVYRKEMSRLRPTYRNWLNQIEIFPELQHDRVRIVPGRASARGLEVYAKRDTGGRFTWWASYALARVRERIDAIVTGAGPYPFRGWVPGVNDQRHTAYLDLNYRPGPRWRLNLAWQYHTGWPFTDQVMRRGTTNEGGVYFYTEPGPPHGARYPAFHRLDLRVSRHFETRSGRVSAFLELVNIYDRGNVRTYNYPWHCTGSGCSLGRSPEYWFGLLPSLGVSWSWGE